MLREHRGAARWRRVAVNRATCGRQQAAHHVFVTGSGHIGLQPGSLGLWYDLSLANLYTYSVSSPAGAAAGLVRLEQEHLQPGLSGMSENEFCNIYL